MEKEVHVYIQIVFVVLNGAMEPAITRLVGGKSSGLVFAGGFSSGNGWITYGEAPAAPELSWANEMRRLGSANALEDVEM